MWRIFKKKAEKLNQSVFTLWFNLFKVWLRFYKWYGIALFFVVLLQPLLYVAEVVNAGRILEAGIHILGQAYNSSAIVLGVPYDILWLLALQFLLIVIEYTDYFLHTLIERRITLYADIFHDEVIGKKYSQLSVAQFENPKIARLLTIIRSNQWIISDLPFYLIGAFVWSLGLFIVLLIFAKINLIFLILFGIFLTLRFLVYRSLGTGIYNIWHTSGDLKIKFEAYNTWPYQTQSDTVAEMKVMGFQKWFLQKSISFNKKFAQSFFKKEIRNKFKDLAIDYFLAFTKIFVYFYLLKALISGQITLTEVYTGVGLLGYLGYFSHQAFYNWSYVLRNRKVVQDLYKFISLKPIIRSGRKKIDIEHIRFYNVWFKYPDSTEWIIKNMKLDFTLGEKIALVGENGAGKTTLLKLLLRIYDPIKGRILVNGVDLKELDLEYYYSQIGLLTQNFITPKIPVFENIALGLPDTEPDMPRVYEAAKKTGAHEFIKGMPKGYKTWLNRELKSGSWISGGQWQRLAISRVFYKNPRLIILDEPTSAIDALGEKKIFETLFSEVKDAITLVVSHRLNSIVSADKIYVLRKGRLVEQGNFQNLLKKHGVFYNMWRAQNELKGRTL